jgi:hypothetical protein
LPAP